MEIADVNQIIIYLLDIPTIMAARCVSLKWYNIIHKSDVGVLINYDLEHPEIPYNPRHNIGPITKYTSLLINACKLNCPYYKSLLVETGPFIQGQLMLVVDIIYKWSNDKEIITDLVTTYMTLVQSNKTLGAKYALNTFCVLLQGGGNV